MVYRLRSYLQTAKKILETYTGKEPLSEYVKNFYIEGKKNGKKYGAKDRRFITSFCFNFYRLGKALLDMPIEEKIIIATFLCENESHAWLKLFKPHWDAIIHETIERKIELTKTRLNFSDIFPLVQELSEGIDHTAFCKSFLVQPNLFLRIRNKRNALLFDKINRSKISYTLPEEDCIAMPNGTSLENIVDVDKEVVIQDYSSQQVLNYLKNPAIIKSLGHLRHFEITRNENVLYAWDCCAASGGKSILLYDILKRSVMLTVSDIRINILFNLHQRFRRAGIKKYNYFIDDLCGDKLPVDSPMYGIILCDVPCTGSGTWGRAPEQLYFFDKKTILDYSETQKKIVSNTIPILQKDGLFIYITCSVFKQENEMIAAFIQKKHKLKLLYMELIKGYNKRADTMFVAVFKK